MARTGATQSQSIPEISRAEGLSIPNVAKLMRILRMGGLVESVRGQSGGYTLAKSPEQVSVGEVLTLLGGTLFGPQFCDRHAGLERVCTHSTDCSLRHLWSTIQQIVANVLNRTTLRDLVREEQDMSTWLEIHVQNILGQEDIVTRTRETVHS